MELNVHFQSLYLDGVYMTRGAFEPPEFLPANLLRSDVDAKGTVRLEDPAVAWPKAEMITAAILAQVRTLAAEVEAAKAEEFKVWHQRAEEGDVVAMYDLGHSLHIGLGVPQDLQRAAVWYAQAAARSHKESMTNLGVCHARGGDDVKARRWYLKAAEAGDSLAMCNLGWQCLLGDGTPKDLHQARMWLKRADDTGDGGSGWAMSRLLREEDAVGNAPRWTELLKQTADQRAGEAAIEWAQCLWRGEGVEPDAARAEWWMCVAASEGYKEAQKWLSKHGQEWIAEWLFVPQVSFGPLRLGEPLEHLMEPLSLEVGEGFMFGPEVSAKYKADHPDQDAGSWPLSTRLYNFGVDREGGLVERVNTRFDTDLAVRWGDTLIVGSSLEGILRCSGASDWVVEKCGETHSITVGCESLGIDLDVEGDMVSGLTIMSEWETDEQFRI